MLPRDQNVPTSTPLSLFFCYSHEDEELRDKIECHLSSLKRRRIIDSWHDRRIVAGTNWQSVIEYRLAHADIVILLVSPSFMASDYCYETEMKEALSRHERGDARVIPVIVRPVDWGDAPFSRLQVLPKDATPVTRWPDQDQALLDVARGIKNAVFELQELRKRGTGSAQDDHWLTSDDIYRKKVAAEVLELESELDARDRHVDQLTEQLLEETHKYEELEEENQQLRDENLRLRTEGKAYLKTLQARIEELEEECQKRADIYESTHKEAALKVDTLIKRNRALCKEIAQLKKQ